MLLAAALLFHAAFQSAGPAEAARIQAVEAVEHEWLAHLSDRAVLERILAPDFQHPVAQGVVLDRDQHIAWAVTHPKSATRKAVFEALKVRVYGNTAVATGMVRDANLDGSGARRTMFTDVFIERDGRWQAVSAQETAVAPGQ